MCGERAGGGEAGVGRGGTRQRERERRGKALIYMQHVLYRMLS